MIYIKSFSKVLLPGLRIAAVVLPKVLRNTFEEYKKWMDLNTSVLSQGALDIYIKSGIFNSNKNHIKKIYSERMATLKQTSNEIKIPQIKLHIPDTGFYGCIEFLNKFNMDMLMKECNKKDISIKDMNDHYLKDYFSNDLLMLSVGSCKSSDIKIGVSSILKIIKKYYD